MAPPRKCAASWPPSNTSKRVATQKNSTPKKKKSKTTVPLSSLGFSSSKHPEFQKGMKILLDDEIYDDEPPNKVKGKYFVYQISKMNADGKTVTIEYKDQVIDKHGDRFQVFKESEEKQVCHSGILFFQYCLLTYLF